MNVRSSPIVGLVVGLAVSATAIVLYYASPVRVGQLWVYGIHVHHLYIGAAISLLSFPLWRANHRSLALFLLGVGLVMVADGVRWAIGFAG